MTEIHHPIWNWDEIIFPWVTITAHLFWQSSECPLWKSRFKKRISQIWQIWSSFWLLSCFETLKIVVFRHTKNERQAVCTSDWSRVPSYFSIEHWATTCIERQFFMGDIGYWVYDARMHCFVTGIGGSLIHHVQGRWDLQLVGIFTPYASVIVYIGGRMKPLPKCVLFVHHTVHYNSKAFKKSAFSIVFLSWLYEEKRFSSLSSF